MYVLSLVLFLCNLKNILRVSVSIVRNFLSFEKMIISIDQVLWNFFFLKYLVWGVYMLELHA